MSKANRERKAQVLNSETHKREVATMVEKREEVHAPGQRILEATGSISPVVNVFGKYRFSHNSLVIINNILTLVNGIALPWFNKFDATASMAENVEKCFIELGSLFEMTHWLRKRYNLQMANAIFQDVKDRTPVFQMTQFESSQQIANQLRLLVSGEYGWDEIEDMEFAEAYALYCVIIDIFELYGLKGYSFLIGDQRGRGQISSADFEKHLGHKLGNAKSVTQREMSLELGKRWHQMYIQVATDNQPAVRSDITVYWEQMLKGCGYVILCPRAQLLAETQVGAVYLLETAGVTQAQFVEFMIDVTSKTDEHATQADALLIWKALMAAGIEIGAQTKHPNYPLLPKPGDQFAREGDAWPIGHVNEKLNVERAADSRMTDGGESDGSTGDSGSTPAPTPRKNNWKLF